MGAFSDIGESLLAGEPEPVDSFHMGNRRPHAASLIQPRLEPLEPRKLFAAVYGLVFADKVTRNNLPDAGEGMAGCVVTFNNNADHTVSTPVTGAQGEYSTTLAPGTYHLSVDGPGVKTPYDNPSFVVGDTDINFNVQVTADDQSHAGPPPDLAVAISGPTGTLVTDGTTQPIKVTVSNKGGTYSGDVKATVYFSTDKVIDENDAHLAPITVPGVHISKGKSITVPFDAALFAPSLPVGSYFLLARLETAGETNTANNSVSSKSAVALVAPIATVVPTFNGHAKISKAKSFPFSVKFKNTGNAAAAGTVAFAIFAHPSSGPDIPLATLPATSFSSGLKGSSATASTAISVASLPPGTYQLIATATFTLTSPTALSFQKTINGPTFKIK